MNPKAKKAALKKGAAIADALFKLFKPSKNSEVKRGYKHKTVKPRYK